MKKLPSGESLDKNVTGKGTDSATDGDTASQQTLRSSFIPSDIIDFGNSIKVNRAEVGDGISEIKGTEGKAGYNDNKLDEGLVPLGERVWLLVGMWAWHCKDLLGRIYLIDARLFILFINERWV